MSKPAIPKGTRDFDPIEMGRRKHIFKVIESVFQSYGFQPIETPAMENLETLTGKYGDEGDQLIFKILNNGDFLAKADHEALASSDYKRAAFSIAKKALRYDLTVPFARFVVMNQHRLSFPFRRYQIQPVWRGDRPGRGRYQEFFQCDADVVGTNSLICEAELIRVFDEALMRLNIPGVVIHLNNRKILAGIAEVAGVTDRLVDLTVAIDKIDKIGREGVDKELLERGFSAAEINALNPLFTINGAPDEVLNSLRKWLGNNNTAVIGLNELQTVIQYTHSMKLKHATLMVDPTLARGLNYYTGAIFEVKVTDAPVGSICGGGRYDDLTGIFGMKGLSGVGISFGADRIYDVLEHFSGFANETSVTTQVLFLNFGGESALLCIEWAERLRSEGHHCEVYPDEAKIKKQMKYANDKHIPFVVLAGDEEIKAGELTLKTMSSGEQIRLKPVELSAYLTAMGPLA